MPLPSFSRICVSLSVYRENLPAFVGFIVTSPIMPFVPLKPGVGNPPVMFTMFADALSGLFTQYLNMDFAVEIFGLLSFRGLRILLNQYLYFRLRY